MNFKVCYRCKKKKPISGFSKNKSQPDGYQLYCKPCKQEKQREYYTSDKGRLHIRKMNLKWTYGITLEQYNEMFEQQNGVCAICGKLETAILNNAVKRLSVDHNHKTGKVRALLCHTCNMYVGMVENKQLVKRINKYLKGHSD